MKDKNKWLSINPDDANKQKYKTPKYPELENSLMIWFNQALLNKRVITGDIILVKSKKFTELLDINDFKGSDGWVSNFKKRNNIKQYNLHGEASSAPSEEIISEERRKLQEIISEFPLEHVYNCDETGKKIFQYSHNIYCCCCKSTKYFVLLRLFWDLELLKTLSMGSLPGTKKSKKNNHFIDHECNRNS